MLIAHPRCGLTIRFLSVLTLGLTLRPLPQEQVVAVDRLGDLKGFAMLGRVWVWLLQSNLVLALLSGQLGSAEIPSGDSGSLTVVTTTSAAVKDSKAPNMRRQSFELLCDKAEVGRRGIWQGPVPVWDLSLYGTLTLCGLFLFDSAFSKSLHLELALSQ